MLWLLLFQNVAEGEHKKLESKLCWSPKPESEKQKILWPSTPPLHGIVKKAPPMTSWGWLQKRVIQTPVKIRSFKAEQEPYCQISWGGGDSLYQERSGRNIGSPVKIWKFISDRRKLKNQCKSWSYSLPQWLTVFYWTFAAN